MQVSFDGFEAVHKVVDSLPGILGGGPRHKRFFGEDSNVVGYSAYI